MLITGPTGKAGQIFNARLLADSRINYSNRRLNTFQTEKIVRRFTFSLTQLDPPRNGGSYPPLQEDTDTLSRLLLQNDC
jgi:hypothetical protein